MNKKSNSNPSNTGPLTGVKVLDMSRILAGPTSGSAAAPTFRALVSDDIPALAHTKISDFDTGVRTNRLDQMAAPTGSV